MTHEEATAKFKRCRNKESGYKLANNTRLQKRGNAFAVRLHETDIVMIRPDGTYRLNTGGWRTVTTKDRINSFIHRGILSQRKSIWYLGDTTFYDGMLIDSDGKVIGKNDDDDLITERGVKRLTKEVDSFCSQFSKNAMAACIGHDIGPLEEYAKHKLPNAKSKGHITHFWKTAMRSHTGLRWTEEGGHTLFYKWVYWAVMSSNYTPKFVWEMIRRDCLNGRESFHLKNCLQSFVRNRKPLVLDQVLFGDLKIRKFKPNNV